MHAGNALDTSPCMIVAETSLTCIFFLAALQTLTNWFLSWWLHHSLVCEMQNLETGLCWAQGGQMLSQNLAVMWLQKQVSICGPPHCGAHGILCRVWKGCLVSVGALLSGGGSAFQKDGVLGTPGGVSCLISSVWTTPVAGDLPACELGGRRLCIFPTFPFRN